MSPEESLQLRRSNAVLTGLVAGIVASFGFALMVMGLVGIAIHEAPVGFLSIIGGAAFFALASVITKP